MKLVIHLGLHRAASTSLQAWFESNRPAWEAQRRFLFTDLSSGSQGSVFGALLGTTLRTLGPDMVADLVGGELDDRATDGWEAGLISDENLLGLLPGVAMPAFAWAGALTAVIERLARSHHIVPVLVVRDHLAWIESLYRIAQFRADPRDFASFAAAALPDGGGLFATLAALERAAAPEKPVVASLEAIGADGGRGFLGDVAGRLGVAPAVAPLLPRRNPSPSRLACTLRQEAGRRGGLLVFEDSQPVQELIGRLSASPRERDEVNLAVLADIVRRRTVRVAADEIFQSRLAAAQQAFATAPAAAAFLSRDDAAAIVADAIAAAEGPLLPADAMTSLAARFADDRRQLAERYVPQWKT